MVADNRSALQDAVANNADLDKREAAIKKIAGGKPYKAIFDATYPRSRFADCEVFFKLAKMDKDALQAIYNADPEQLDAEEYAGLVAAGADEEVLEKALSLYPDDETLNAIAGQKAIEAGDIDKAINCFKKAGDSAEVMNNLGGCYLIKGDVENAAKCYDKAKELSVAAQNAQELKELKINQKYFNK